MSGLPIVLLPGMDGTGDLFERFVRFAPAEFQPIVIALPERDSYDALVDAIDAQLPHARFVVVGESFSGPLALRVARRASDRVAALVLCNSFIAPPRRWLLRMLPWRWIFALPVLSRWIRRLLVGRTASNDLVDAVRHAIAKTSKDVLASRMRIIQQLDDEELLRTIECPILDLRGIHDVLVPLRTGDAIRRINQRVQTATIAAPHLLLQVAPEAAWRAIQVFMKRG
jgi:pimeloyl-ACP methyl ester carboxylesterase